jgi:regulatory protein spx
MFLFAMKKGEIMMLTLYTSPSCTSCVKLVHGFKNINIPFVERNIFSEPLTIDELKAILQMTEEGTEEINLNSFKGFSKAECKFG